MMNIKNEYQVGRKKVKQYHLCNVIKAKKQIFPLIDASRRQLNTILRKMLVDYYGIETKSTKHMKITA